MNQGNLLTKEQYWEIPFSATKKELATKAKLKGISYNFLLDTGAPLFISKELQNQFNYPVIVHSETQDAGGNLVRTDIVKIDTIQFGPFIFTDVAAIVIDTKNTPLECAHIDGNIGSNLLRHLYLQFDVHEKKIAVTDDKKLLKTAFATTFPMRINQQSDVYMPVKVNGNFADTVHFDSGDGQLYEMSKKASERYRDIYANDIIRTGNGIISIGIGGVGDFFPQYLIKPKTIKMGNVTASGGTVTIAGNDRSRVGRELLNYGILELNYPDSTYSFEPYTDAYNSLSYDYGFRSMIDNEDHVIAGCVWERSEAMEKGLRSGDLILKINETDFSNLSKCDASDALRKELLQKTYQIEITFRSGTHKPKTIRVNKVEF